MSPMHNPPHPGETLRDDVLPALALSVTDAAVQLGVTRAALSRVLNGRAGISPGMALRLERWLGVEHGGRAGVWLGLQAAFDLWHAQQSARPALTEIKPVNLEMTQQELVADFERAKQRAADARQTLGNAMLSLARGEAEAEDLKVARAAVTASSKEMREIGKALKKLA